MDKLFLAGAGGFLGAVARYLLSGVAQRWWGGTFPVGTLLVNVAGCLVMGGLMTLVEDRELLAPGARLFIMVGLLGSFTTFSTFSYETVELLRDGQFTWALWNISANVLLGVGALLLGRAGVKLAGL